MHSPGAYTASGEARAVAYLIDLCAAAMVLIPAACATYILGTPGAGALEFSLIVFAYQLYFLQFRNRCPPGKYIRNISVVSLRGGALEPAQCFARATATALPWALIGSGDLASLQAALLPISPGTLPTLGTVLIVVDVLCLEFLPSRRTLTDRLAGTLVVNLPPVQPHRAPAAPMYSATDAEFGRPPKRPPPK
jgi:uncharacterized RDD family membrane protein YckC